MSRMPFDGHRHRWIEGEVSKGGPRHRWRFVLACVLGAGIGASPLPAQEARDAPAPLVRASSEPPRAGDVIRLRIWREPELSGEFLVDGDGIAVIPRFGPMRVTGESAEVLRERLVTAFTPHLNHPSIEVTVLRRVQVLGNVRNPGIFTLEPTMTVGDALAVAGGMTPQGHPNRLELIRGGRVLDVRLTRETRIDDSPINSGDQLYVPERNWFSRNTGILATGMTAGVSLLIAIMFR